MALKKILALSLFAASATAKTDIDGCTSFTSMVTVRPEPGYGNTYASIIWYVPDTLEICKGVDCGGGRAPPKSVPGCPLYQGTETVTPEFLTADPMKPTAAPTTEEVKETSSAVNDEDDDEQTGPRDGKAQHKDDDKDDDKVQDDKDEQDETEDESSAAPTTIYTSHTKPAENVATPTTDADDADDADESSTSTGTNTGADDDDEATTTGPDGADETGAAGTVAVNMVFGAAAAAFALL